MTQEDLVEDKLSANDLTIIIGMGRLCTASLDTFRAVADKADSTQLARKLREIAQSREQKLARTIPASYLERSIAAYAPAFAEQASLAYTQVRRNLGDRVEPGLVLDLYQADRHAVFLLRRSLKSMDNANLVLNLSSLIASFQLSNELLKGFACAQP